MKDYKTINKRPEINKYPIQGMNISIIGKILYVISSESNNMFILTDQDNFYVIEKGKFNDIKEYKLKSILLEQNKEKREEKKIARFQSKALESQIWCDKLGTHVIIKYKNVTFYYNPFMAKKIEELDLFMFGNTCAQPYAVAFNDDFYDMEDTGKILFSDYNSVIYELQLKLNENKEMIRLSFGQIFNFKQEKVKKGEEDDDDIDFNFFKMEENDRILDMKLIVSGNDLAGDRSLGNEGKNIFILAITKHVLFQFYGKNSFKDVFDNYSLENGNILKAYKKFISIDHVSDKYSRIQLINENRLELEKKTEILFGFMTQCGYITGKLGDCINPEPQKKFKVIKYYKPLKENEEEMKPKNSVNSHGPIPIAVCQSINHIFFLYHDSLVIQNKLTNRIIHDIYLAKPYNDMYYNQLLNGIILYNDTDISKISLEHEFKYLYEDYIEIGNYKSALILSKDNKYVRPKLHKIYADYLFDKKQFWEAAEEYAYSDEIFEHVCMKFLSTNNNLSLMKYLCLVYYLRINKSFEENKEGKENKDNYFIEKYLINTWIFELLIGINENDKNKTIISHVRDKRKEKEYFDKYLLYFVLNIYGKNDEFREIANLKEDYEAIILHLINQKKIDESLESFKTYLKYGVESVFNILKKLFYNYSNLLIKENPKNFIEILDTYFLTNKQEEIIKILISPDLSSIAKNKDEFKEFIGFIKKLKKGPIKNGNEEINFSKNRNLHNLIILLYSYCNIESYKGELIEYLKRPIKSREINKKLNQNINDEEIYFDLYFAKKIFEKKNDEIDKKALCYIFYLLKQYTESIDIAINNKLIDDIQFLAGNIPELKLKKKIWLNIFDNKMKTESLENAKNVIKESKGILNIQDVLPLMGDNVKINQFKDELNVCIKSYEDSLQNLKKEFKEFNDSNDLINKDIELSQKKAIKMNYTRLKCYKCGKKINGVRFFMFPCKHIFDVECLIETYKEFNSNNLGDKKFKLKVKVINDLFNKINNLKERKQKSKEEVQKTKEIENLGTLQKLKTLNIKTLLAKENKVQFTSEHESMLNDTQKILYDYLDEECLLCGKEMIGSTQIDFGDEDDVKWQLI